MKHKANFNLKVAQRSARHPFGRGLARFCELSKRSNSPAFTLIELLTVIAVIGVLASLFLPVLARAKGKAHQTTCLSNQRQLGLSATLYMMDNNGSLFRHHEGWVLDDGTQVDDLPRSLGGCAGGGMGNSQAEKPWAILFQPYLNNRQVGFCPADRAPRSRLLAHEMQAYNGAITSTVDEPPANSEQGIAERERLNMQSYLLNSIFTHRSCRYALDGSLHGFATEAALSALANPNVILFSERNSEAMNAADNAEFGSVSQDDYDTWVGEAALVRWGAGQYGTKDGSNTIATLRQPITFTPTDMWNISVGARRGWTNSPITSSAHRCQTLPNSALALKAPLKTQSSVGSLVQCLAFR